MVYGPTGNRVAWLPLYNLNCKARNTPVDKTGVNFSCCSQGVLRTVDAPSLLFRLNRALELIRYCEKELCEIQTSVAVAESMYQDPTFVILYLELTKRCCQDSGDFKDKANHNLWLGRKSSLNVRKSGKRKPLLPHTCAPEVCGRCPILCGVANATPPTCQDGAILPGRQSGPRLDADPGHYCVLVPKHFLGGGIRTWLGHSQGTETGTMIIMDLIFPLQSKRLGYFSHVV